MFFFFFFFWWGPLLSSVSLVGLIVCLLSLDLSGWAFSIYLGGLLVLASKGIVVRPRKKVFGFDIVVTNGLFLIMASLGAFRISCPLQGHEGCSGGNEKGFTKKYFIDHLGTRHFKTAALKASHKARIASDLSLFATFDQELHQAGIWLCGECLCTHTFSKKIVNMLPVIWFSDLVLTKR